MSSRIRTAITAAVVAAAVGITPLAIAPGASAVGIGNEGCTPGYWKNHLDSWEEFSPDQTLESVFDLPASLSQYADVTLEEALNFGGGSGLAGAARILLRAAVAAVLNAAHDGLGYPWRRGRIIRLVNEALASGDRQTIINLAERLDKMNNLGCPLN